MARVGRPLKFKTIEELQAKIDAYFESITVVHWDDVGMRDPETGEKILDDKGLWQTKPVKSLKFDPPATIAGLSLAVGATRSLIHKMEDKEEYIDAINAAKMIIAKQAENRLNTRGNSGDIFMAKNFGWQDKTEIEQTTTHKVDLGEAFRRKKSNLLPNVRELEEDAILPELTETHPKAHFETGFEPVKQRQATYHDEEDI